jgi:hypothetical protein
LITNKKKIYLFTSITVLIILITTGIFIKMNNAKNGIFITKKLDVNTSVYKKINDKVSELIKENGVYLLNTGEDNVTYLILDCSHMSLKNEAPYFSDVKTENKGNSIMVYFNEELKIYLDCKYPEQRLIYKITKDKRTEYVRVFKNGEETHFDSVIDA